jgi:hypothetical protein
MSERTSAVIRDPDYSYVLRTSPEHLLPGDGV